MDAFGNPMMFNSFPCPSFVSNPYQSMPEQPLLAVMPIIIDDPNNPCNSMANYGAPIKLQTSYPSYPTSYQQYSPPTQPGHQFSTPTMYHQPQPITPQQAPPISSPGYWPQATPQVAQQTTQLQCSQPPPTETPPVVPPASVPTTKAQASLVCTCTTDVHLPYCPDNNLPYCPDNGIYSQYRQPTPQYKQQSSHIKSVRLPTIYKNLYEPARKGDEVIAEYEEVLCNERRPRVYSRQRCHSNRRHHSRGHEVLAEYTEVLDYRPRNYSRGRRSNDDWSDYDDYDSHYDQRSCDLYYDRSYDRSFDRSYEHSHSYDMYHENRRSARRARSPGPNYYPPKAYPNEQPPMPPNVNIDPKVNIKTRQMYNGTPTQQKSDLYKQTEFKQQSPEFNDYRNARSPVSSHPPQRNLRTPRNPPSNFRS